MGVDNDSKLAIGWLVDTKKVRELLAAKRTDDAAPRDYCSKGCLCGDCVEALDMPEGWQLVVASPYYDSEWADRTVVVSAKLDCGDSCEYMYHGMSIPGDVVMSVLSNTALLGTGFSFAVTLGANEAASSPRVMSLPHIW